MGTGSEGNTEFQLLLDLRVWWYCPRLILWEGAPVTQAQSPILAPPSLTVLLGETGPLSASGTSEETAMDTLPGSVGIGRQGPSPVS